MGGGENKYIRLLRLSVQEDRLTLRPPRAGPAALLGFATFLLLTANALLPALNPAPVPSAPKPPPARPWLPGHRVRLTPLVPFGEKHQTTREEWLRRLIKEPWIDIALAFGVFWIVSRLWRDRIVMDRRQNQLLHGSRLVCPLDQVSGVEVDTTPRIVVMNEMALVLADGRKLSLLIYDAPPGAAVWKLAHTVAAFLEVPVTSREDYPLIRKKTKRER